VLLPDASAPQYSALWHSFWSSVLGVVASLLHCTALLDAMQEDKLCSLKNVSTWWVPAEKHHAMSGVTQFSPPQSQLHLDFFFLFCTVLLIVKILAVLVWFPQRVDSTAFQADAFSLTRDELTFSPRKPRGTLHAVHANRT
jgi:hypothetical protein